MRRRSFFVIITFLMLIIITSGIFYYRELKVYGFKLEGFRHFTTDNFLILYKPQSEDDVFSVAIAAEKAYEIVGRDFDYYPEERVNIVMYPDSQSLQAAFGWPADESTQGVYYRGAIYIQAPGAWIEDRDKLSNTFFKKGPMVHEYTHLVVDQLTGGNHTRWFTEGVAQFEEKRVTGYTLKQDFDVKEKDYYPLEDIFYRFDELSDVAKAYITALDMVKILAEPDGIEGIKTMMSALKNGGSPNDIFLERASSTIEGKTLLATNTKSVGGDIFEQQSTDSRR